MEDHIDVPTLLKRAGGYRSIGSRMR